MNRNSVLIFIICCVAVFAVLCSFALSNDFTGDSGDSITHYMYARYAFVHPVLFLNHWAKPLFVLMASPFAQYGFAGIKIFNCICAVLSCFFTFLIAKELKLKYVFLVLPFMFFCPLYFTLIFSGLTEYLFSLLLIVAIYLSLKKDLVTALVIVSFLPFIRSEGLIFLGVFGLYLFSIKKYRLLPFLLVGHVAYGIIGFFHYHDFLWVFTKIPYAKVNEQYGHGKPFDFVHILMYVIEKPMFAMLCTGFLGLVYKIYRKEAISKEAAILIYGGFVIFFVAHSFFWWKGIFGSGGFLVPRVMNAVVPLISIIALVGLNFVAGFLKKPLYGYVIAVLVTSLVIIFPFTNRSKGLVFNKALFTIHENDMVKDKVVPFIRKTIPDYKQYKIYYAQAYIGLVLEIDPFDTLKHGELHKLFTDKIPSKTVVIWDDWFARVEEGMTRDQLLTHKEYSMLSSFEEQEKNRIIQFVVFKKED